MMKKITFFLCSVLFSMSAFAQGWVKPAAPASTPLKAGEACYLYNTGVEGFYLGANEYLTRASYSTTRGYKVYVEEDTRKGAFDGSSYLIRCDIEDGWNAGNSLYLYITDANAIWIDQAIDGENDKSFNFVDQGDGSFYIGLSELNATYKESEGYEKVYFGAKSDLSDTRLYLIDTNEVNDANLGWYFVAPDVYNQYVTDRKQWDAAMKLGALIDEAKTVEGVDAIILAAAEGAYADTTTPEETLNNKAEALANAIQVAKQNQASVDNPVEMLAARGLGTNFTDGEVKGWTSTTNAQNKQASNGNAAVDYNVTGNHYENWNPSQMNPGVISVTANELPTGVYRFEALAFTDVPGATYLFAGDVETEVTAPKISVDDSYSVVTFVNSGSLKVGLNLKEKSAYWIGLDNAGLYFLGAGDDAIALLKKSTFDAEPEFFEMCQASVAEAYDAAKSALESASTLDEVSTAYPAYIAALKAKQESCTAYKQFYDKYMEVEDFIDEYGATYAGPEMDKLADYLMADDIEPGDLYPNGSAAYILANGTLDSQNILKEIDYMVQLRDNAVANSMKDGDDVTGLLKNPHFIENGIWTKEGLPEWPLGPDDYKLAQAYSIVFNVYQDIEGLQDGLYELTLNDFYRPANYGSSDYETFRAYVYMNDDEEKMNHIESDATDEQAHTSDYQTSEGKYVPNDVDGAAIAFKAGRYAQKVYGIVTDGKLRIGVRTDVRYEGCWGVWSDFHLTFRAKNVEVSKEVLASTLPAAEAMLENKCGAAELDALRAAVDAAKAATDENVYDALVALKKAMADVKECTDSYTALAAALSNLEGAIADNPSSSSIADAQSLYNEVQTAYDNGAYNNADAIAKTEEVAAMAATVKLGDVGEGTDVTSLIVNPTFDPTKGDKSTGVIEGWVTTPMNGYKEYSVSYNRSGFHLYQDLSGLPRGRYIVKVHTYYRAGYYNEEADRINNGIETHLTNLYAETSNGTVAIPVKNLIDDADTDDFGAKCYTYDDGRHAPDGTSATVAWFAQGKYMNELEFVVGDDGKARIGLKKDQTFDNDYEVVGAWELYYIGDNDRTSLIVNPTFDPTKGDKGTGVIEGWVTTPMNGYKEYSVSYNRAGFHLYQDLTGVPAGKYEVTVHTYYRAGYYNEEFDRIQNGVDTKLTTLYAETSETREETPVMNLLDDADKDDFGAKCYTYDDGRHAPDGTSATVAWFGQGKYLNRLQFEVPADGKVRIGLIKEQTFDNDYEVVGAWNLYYIGQPTAIESVQADDADDNASVVGIYTLSGVRVETPQKGVNIIRMSDGTSRKILVK